MMISTRTSGAPISAGAVARVGAEFGAVQWFQTSFIASKSQARCWIQI